MRQVQRSTKFSGPAATAGAPVRGDPAWYQDLGVLWARPAEVVPSAQHTREERLNAAVRLTVYASAATAAAQGALAPLLVGCACVAAVTGAHAAAASAPPSAGAAARGRAARAQPACVRSTPDNPFANMLLTDDPARGPACAYDDMAEEVRANFNRGLPRNMYDVFERENSQRQFYTMPVTTAAADTRAFAEFAYGPRMRPGCKEDPSRCTGFQV